MKYTCAYKWLLDNEDVVDVTKVHNEYDVSCRGVYVGKVDAWDQASVDAGFFSACLAPREKLQTFMSGVVTEYKRLQNRNKGREVLLKINELEDTEGRE